MPMIVSSPTLASRLAKTTADRDDVAHHVDLFILHLFSQQRRWLFTPPDGIDVYQVTDTAAVAFALHMQGFVTVTLHDHREARFLSCKCPVRERTL